MYTAYREYYIHGQEGDATDLTVKYFDSLEKAIKYVDRYARGIRFVSSWIEDDDGKYLYEILNGGANTYDYTGKAWQLHNAQKAI